MIDSLTARPRGIGNPFGPWLPQGLALALMILASLATAAPVGTTFDYQGAIARSGEPANGEFEMEFRLFASASSDLEVAPTIPPIGSEVLVSFMDGDVNQPVVVGSLNNDAFNVRLEGSGFTSLIASFAVNCDSDKSTISAGFRTPPGPEATIILGAAGFSCEFDLGFNLGLRNWIVRVDDSALAASASCRRSGQSELSCAAYDYNSRPVPAGLSIALY